VRVLGTDALDILGAVRALEAALAGGLDPEAEPPRTALALGDGQLLVMPSGGAVKLVTVGPREPRVQGVCVVFDPDTLAPAALIDGVALTNLRTPAVSALAVDRLARPDAARLLVFGRGPQAHAHVAAIKAIRPGIAHVDILGRETQETSARRFLRLADVICCCTTAREPLFDGALVADEACVVAIGSHEPDARELDAGLMRRAAVVVESRASAFAEAGDVLLAGVTDVITLAELVRGRVPGDGAPRVFKSTGMAWEDAVVAAAVLQASS
jgi:ornithine cyclodeaminase